MYPRMAWHPSMESQHGIPRMESWHESQDFLLELLELFSLFELLELLLACYSHYGYSSYPGVMLGMLGIPGIPAGLHARMAEDSGN